MSEALSELTKEAVSLPYEEQKELLDVIRISIHGIRAKQRKKLDFDSYVIPCGRANFADGYVKELRDNDRI